MLNSLFVNAAILISFIYLGSQLFRNHQINSQSDVKTKIATGILFGLTGCLLMVNSIDLSENMVMDFRAIALIVSVIFCGPVSSLITTLIIIAFRFVYFGINDASLMAMVNLTIIFLSCNVISRYVSNLRMKYIYMSIVNIISSSIWTVVLASNMDLAVKIIFSYTLSHLLVSFLIYFVLLYIFNTNDLYARLKRESTIDFLTGLYNVREFDRLLNKASAIAVDKQENLSLLMIDLDYFKKVNDTYGHSSGDMVLKQLSHILVSSCRDADILSRNGGEEFTVILLNSNYKQATEIAEKIRKDVEEHSFSIENEKTIQITVSIGVSSYPEKTDHPGHLLQGADSALYMAKHQGRNQVR